MVDASDYGLIPRLKTRLGFPPRFGVMFLGYCSRHKQYFLDLKHTNGDIRCPMCEVEWLASHRVEA